MKVALSIVVFLIGIMGKAQSIPNSKIFSCVRIDGSRSALHQNVSLSLSGHWVTLGGYTANNQNPVDLNVEKRIYIQSLNDVWNIVTVPTAMLKGQSGQVVTVKIQDVHTGKLSPGGAFLCQALGSEG